MPEDQAYCLHVNGVPSWRIIVDGVEHQGFVNKGHALSGLAVEQRRSAARKASTTQSG